MFRSSLFHRVIIGHLIIRIMTCHTNYISSWFARKVIQTDYSIKQLVQREREREDQFRSRSIQPSLKDESVYIDFSVDVVAATMIILPSDMNFYCFIMRLYLRFDPLFLLANCMFDLFYDGLILLTSPDVWAKYTCFFDRYVWAKYT